MTTIELAYYLGLVMGLMALALTGVTLCLRISARLQEKGRQAFRATWRPLLLQSLEGELPHLPRLRRWEPIWFLELWTSHQEMLRGQATREALNGLARSAGMDRAAMRLLCRGTLQQRFAAATALGFLQHADAWDELCEAARARDSRLSLAAARALMQIEAGRALPVLSPLISVRHDWPAAEVAALLDEASPEVVAEALSKAAHAAEPAHAARLIRFLEATQCDPACAAVRSIESSATDEEVLAACLSLFGSFADPRDLPAIRRHLGHPSGYVRGQVAGALARMGTAEDQPGLVALLADPEWGVRYRAAQALAAMPFMSVEQLERLRDEQAGRDARGVLDQVIAEQRLSACLLKPSSPSNGSISSTSSG